MNSLVYKADFRVLFFVEGEFLYVAAILSEYPIVCH